MLEIILEFALVLALAGFFVMWAKWEEQKVKTREERDRRWDEISRAAGLENIIEDRTKDVLHYDEVDRKLRDALKIEMERTSRLDKDCAQLEQSLRSALRCPRNDHVWKDGVCVKCGRVKDG